MAIQNAIAVSLSVVGDGVSSTFVFDLAKDTYSISSPTGSAGQIINWFTEDRKSPLPVAVRALSAVTATLVGTVITLTFSTPPSSSATSVLLYLLFASE